MQNNLLVTYRWENSENLTGIVSDCMHRYSNQIYYLARSAVNDELRADLNHKTIELFQLKESHTETLTLIPITPKSEMEESKAEGAHLFQPII